MLAVQCDGVVARSFFLGVDELGRTYELVLYYPEPACDQGETVMPAC